MDGVLSCVPRKVTAEMNVALNGVYTAEEVKTALLQMYPKKAPGPDDFPAHFFSDTGTSVGRRLLERY